MDSLPLAASQISDFFYMVPLIVTISLVYAATRHEFMEAIIAHAFRVGVWIVGFMGMVFGVLLLISWWL